MRILQPEFPEPLYPADFSAAVSEYRDTEERIEQKIFKNFRAENERFGHAEFFGCVFENCKFNDCAFERFEYTNAVFRGCDFSNGSLRNSYFKQCAFLQSKWMGADLSESVLKEIVATGCNFSYANLNAEKMQRKNAERLLEGVRFFLCRRRHGQTERRRLFQMRFYAREFLHDLAQRD